MCPWSGAGPEWSGLTLATRYPNDADVAYDIAQRIVVLVAHWLQPIRRDIHVDRQMGAARRPAPPRASAFRRARTPPRRPPRHLTPARPSAGRGCGPRRRAATAGRSACASSSGRPIRTPRGRRGPSRPRRPMRGASSSPGRQTNWRRQAGGRCSVGKIFMPELYVTMLV